ncbi:MAG: PIG-L family deacetylase, partial [Clostridia bacterium]|nr:PIG-L family deacetylase [Clostridia bacterium]
LTEICGFAGEVPSWVQRWEEPLEKADLCLFSSHADDEQLFFAGVLPYYAGEKGYAVQVIYFSDHNKKPLRRHELLSGLWAVGVKSYPVISSFPDRYSTSQAEAEKHLQESGFTREDVLSFQVEMIRRFQPLVVVGHDPSGEYGHGQHMLNSATLQEAVLSAGNEENFPDSAEKYGVWEVPKTYLHLLDENEIVMDWDTPLEFFGGKSAFEISQIGFSYHKSQHKYWFYTWLFGENGKIEKASQIKTYSPCKYGLFRSLVGPDLNKNDFFENLLTYEMQEKKAEEEKLRLEAEEKARLEEENRKAEELEKKLREEREKTERENKKKRILSISLLISFLFVIFLVAFLVVKKRKNKKKQS